MTMDGSFRRKVCHWLDEYNIEFIPSYNFQSPSGDNIFVDFYLPEYNLILDYVGYSFSGNAYMKNRVQRIHMACEGTCLSYLMTIAPDPHIEIYLLECLHLIKTVGRVKMILKI
jgi:hypothetical protein